MNVREAQIEDAEAIAAVHIASETAAYKDLLPDQTLKSLSLETQADAWRKRLSSNTSKTLVALLDGDLRGWINFGASRDADEPSNVLELRAMYVHPDKWGQGAGTALWKRMAEDAKRNDWREVTLWVLERNVPARQFYENKGFVLDADIHKQVEYDGERFRAVRYRQSIEGL